MPDQIIAEPIEPGLTVLTLNRAERRNALSIALLDTLSDAVARLQADSSQRVVILRGAGTVFSAGLDLKEAAEAALVETSAASLERALWTLRESPLVTVAAVHGGAYAGGAGIMAACDLTIAADTARFGFPEARRGLLPALICGVLRHKIREGDLRNLLLVGDDISADEAQQMGLIQRVVAEADLLQSAVAIARSILRGGPDTIRRTKHLLNDVFSAAGAATVQLGEVHLKARHSDEAREGLAAFLEKREPHWK